MTSTVYAVVPAHDEQDQLEPALLSLLRQDRDFDRIILASDNSTDNTVAIARRIAEQYPQLTVFETQGNTARKAGALNQAWQQHAQEADFIVCMDGDTILHPNFLKEMLTDIESDTRLGGVAVRPALKQRPPPGTSVWGSLIWRLVAIEYSLYGRSLKGKRYRTEVLAGCGAIFRNNILKTIATTSGAPFDETSIVEDYRLTLDVRELGHTIRISSRALSFTDSPVTVRTLWRQRLRWQAGTIIELRKEGFRPWTRRSWGSQWLSTGGIALRLGIISLWVFLLSTGASVTFNLIWLIPPVVAAVDRLDGTRYLRGADWKDRVLAVLLLPAEGFALLREAWSLTALVLAYRGKHIKW